MESAETKDQKSQSKIKLFIVLAIIAGAVAGLSMPLSNLIFAPERPDLFADKMQDSHFKLAGSVMQAKCLDCHSTETAHPWYFALPVAKTMISKDIEDGLMAIDLSDGLFSKEQFKQAQLAKIESAIHLNSMPPKRYVAMHWDTVLKESEKQDILSWVKHVRSNNYASDNAAEQFAGEVIQPLPLTVDVDVKKVELGNKLFHDKRLSLDDTISCATCHGLDKGGTDQEQFATGIGDQLGPINSPTVYNSSYNFVQFWDGRSTDLKDQAGGPVTNPIEMGDDWNKIIPKLVADKDYQKVFKELYAGILTEENVRDAIAIFEESLITPNSAFDEYLMGDSEAITEEQLSGYHTFIEAGCTSCHFGVAVGGGSYEKMGSKKDYFKVRGNVLEADNGRFNVTKDENDRHKFKVPVLRNIEVTYPYFHDGSTKVLAEAIETMGKYQLEKELTGKQISQIEKFLLALTGEYQGKSLSVISE